MLRVKHLHCKSTVVIARPSTVWDLSTHILNMYMKIVIMLQTNYDDINYGPEQHRKKKTNEKMIIIIEKRKKEPSSPYIRSKYRVWTASLFKIFQ